YEVTEGTFRRLVRQDRQPWYRLAADAAPGNSGGPVVDRATGRVMGMTTWVIYHDDDGGRRSRRDSLTTDDTFCVPCSAIREAVAAVQSGGDRDAQARRATARYMCEMVTLQVCVAQQ